MLKQALRKIGVNRQTVAEARLSVERHAIAAMPRRSRPRRSRILAYHSIGQPEFGVNDVSPVRFRSQIEMSLKRGFKFTTADRIARGECPDGHLAMTFDDGWRSIADRGADILFEYGIPSTLFVVTGWVDAPSNWHRSRVLNWDELGRLAERGVRLGSHSVTHPDFGKISRMQAEEELEASRAAFEARLGLSPVEFAIPYGQSRNWTDDAMQLARRAGYELIYSQAEATRPAGTLPRTFVTRADGPPIFRALLDGAFDRWEEWY